MSAWRRTALDKLRKCSQTIERAENIRSLWTDLWLEFERAYQEPVDPDFVASVYKYGSWCLIGSHNSEIQTAAIIGFYERLPLTDRIRRDMPNNLSREDFFGLEEVFSSHLSDSQYRELAQEFLDGRRRSPSDHKKLNNPRGRGEDQ